VVVVVRFVAVLAAAVLRPAVDLAPVLVWRLRVAEAALAGRLVAVAADAWLVGAPLLGVVDAAGPSLAA
jgi:hypothetical protein